MPKKNNSIEEQRNEIAKSYRRGAKVLGKKKAAKTDNPEGAEREWKRQKFIFLKASEFSYSYISDATGVTRRTLKLWAAEEEIQKQIRDLQEDLVSGAVRLIKTYAVEAVEMLMEIARKTADDKVAVQALTEILDRTGLTKVNKSESVVHKTSEITDVSMLERLQKVPYETQKEVAELMAQAEALIENGSEHADK